MSFALSRRFSPFVLAAACLPSLASAEAMLRLTCFDASEGAEVTLNGISHGACPVDVQVASGTPLVIRATRLPDAEHEQIWEQTLELPEGAVKRIEIVLPAPQLTAEAKRARELAAKVKARAEFAAELEAAQGGDEAPILKVIARYEQNGGATEATFWRGKLEAMRAAKVLAAAQAGSLESMDAMAVRYQQGLGVEQDAVKAKEWQDKAAAVRHQAKVAKQRAQLQAKRDAISFTELTKMIFTGANDILSGRRYEGPFGLTMATMAYGFLPVYLAVDGSTAPTNTTQLRKIDKELESLATRPAAWGNPDSLLARVTPPSAASLP